MCFPPSLLEGLAGRERVVEEVVLDDVDHHGLVVLHLLPAFLPCAVATTRTIMLSTT